MKRTRHILVACHELALAGGMLRFERFGREIAKLGADLAYLTLGDPINVQMKTEFEVITFEQALARTWDTTMVPGQAFPPETKNKIGQLKKKNFGYRVQHILNDRTHRRGFLALNRSFLPDLVVFNNRHWPPGSFTDFLARKFIIIEGAVDPTLFSPNPGKPAHSRTTGTSIGSLAKARSLVPLLEAIRLLPDEFMLKIFGRDFFDRQPDLAAKYRDLVEGGRLDFVGPLHERDLPNFYRSCDIVVHTETFAGWANIAAEAMACGLPVICTPHGTQAFAVHGETALVIDTPEPQTIAAAIDELAANDALARRLARNGRQRIAELNWSEYAKSLMAACVDDKRSHYTWAPELGLYGKWPLADRLAGLDALIKRCEGHSILDLGSSEGVIALECLRNGAALVHGFDLDGSRVETSRRSCAAFPAAIFRQADLSRWKSFENKHADILLNAYDIVLYLGLHHHLPTAHRAKIIHQILRKAHRFFAIRTPAAISSADNLDKLIMDEGFEACDRAPPSLESQGELKIFARRRDRPRDRA